MSEEKKLDQSSINKLISQVRGTSPIANETTEQNPAYKQLGITDEDLDKLKKFFKTSIEASTDVLKNVTQKDVHVESISEINVAGGKEISKLIDPPYLATKVDYIEGLRGLDILLIKQSDMNNLISLQFAAMGLDFDEPENDMVVSASNEIMNQMMGHASNILGTEFNILIDISTPETNHIETSSDINFLKEDSLSYIYTTFKLNIDGQVTGDLIKILDADFLGELREIMNNTNTDSTNETTTESNGKENIHTDNHIDTNTSIPEEEETIAHAYKLPTLKANPETANTSACSNRVKDVPIELTVEIGRTKMKVKDILELRKGSIVEINRLAGEQIDLYANGELLAKGEIVVIKDCFALRVLKIVDENDR